MIIPLDLYARIWKWAKDNKTTFRAALSFLLQKGLDPRA